MNLRSHILSSFAFCAGIAATLMFLEWQVPRMLTAISGDFSRVAKLRHSCEVLIVGPSFVKNQVFPAIFEQEASRLGTDLEACRFSGAGMSSFEMLSRTMDLIDLGFPELDLVVFDITMGARPGFQEKNRFKTRMVQWHTPGVLPFAYRTYVRTDLDRAEVASLLLEHGKHVLARMFRLGEAHLQLEGLYLIERAGRLLGMDTKLPRTRIERINAKVMSGVNRLPRHILSAGRPKEPEPTSYERKLHEDKWRSLERDKAELLEQQAGGDSAFAHELRTKTRARGVEAYFLIAPTWNAVSPPSDSLAKRAPLMSDPLEVLDFNRPSLYPELYDIDARGTRNHLNASGSVLYTRLLARNILDRGVGHR